MSVSSKDKLRARVKQLTKLVINAKKQVKKEMAAKAGAEGTKLANAAKQAGDKVCALCVLSLRMHMTRHSPAYTFTVRLVCISFSPSFPYFVHMRNNPVFHAYFLFIYILFISFLKFVVARVDFGSGLSPVLVVRLSAHACISGRPGHCGGVRKYVRGVPLLI